MLITLLATLAAAGAPAPEGPISVVARPWAPFISPSGEPFRSQAVGDIPLQRWYVQADRNGDGALTVDEFQADATRFFAILDGNHDLAIDPEELAVYESEVAPEVQVDSKWKPSRQEAMDPKARAERERAGRDRRPGGNGVDGYQIDGLQGAARYGLLNIPEPVAGADADFNRAVTLAEFRQAAAIRFQLLDDRQDGPLTLQALAGLLPGRPKAGARARATKDSPDARIGQPFPKGD